MNKITINIIAITLCLSVFLTQAQQVQASPYNQSQRAFMKKDRDYKRLIGLTTGVGKIVTDESEEGVLAYANLFMLWFNFSVEHHSFDTRSINNTYTGVGLGSYIQLQYGYSDNEYLVRLRSEFELIGKMTVFVARERYRNKPELDNYSTGIGYHF